jgi:hypothetical protein
MNLIKKARAGDYPTLEFKGNTLTVKEAAPSETWVFNWNPDGTLNKVDINENGQTSLLSFVWNRDTLHSVNRTVKK